MPYYTPLRYPGGKRRLAPVVASLLSLNKLKNVDYIEPYAGGSAVALALLFGEHASTIHINDLSRPVYAFWYSVLNHNADLCQRIRTVRVSMAEWKRQRAVYESRDRVDLTDLGFAAFFLNRTNRSGIIGGGVIGGQKQTGDWGLDARFTKDDLIQRIRRIGRYRNRISIYQRDALNLVKEIVPTLGRNTFTFFDPPYIENSEDLYLNTYDVAGHRRLEKQIVAMSQPWIVTYDCAAIREGLYRSQRRLIYGLSYAAQDRYSAKEVMFLSDDLSVPDEWRKRTFSISHPKAEHKVYATMENVKPQPEIEEGPAAFDRFRRAVKTILGVPKSALPARQKARQIKKRARRRKP